MIRLDITNVDCSDTPDFVLEYAQFSMDRNSDRHCEFGAHPSHYEVAARSFQAFVLRYHYVYGGDVFWYRFVGPRVENLSRLEFFKLPPEQRPAWLTGNGHCRDHIGKFEVPKHWTYVDDELPKWWKARVREEGEEGTGALIPHDEPHY